MNAILYKKKTKHTIRLLLTFEYLFCSNRKKNKMLIFDKNLVTS